jgi:hypothetical protein
LDKAVSLVERLFFNRKTRLNTTEKTMSNENKSNESDHQKPRGRFPGILLRLILAIIVGMIIGGVIYYSAAGWIPYIDQRIIQPIDQNQADLRDFDATQQTLDSQVSDLQSQLNQSQLTITELELALQQEMDQRLALQSTLDKNTILLAEQTQTIGSIDEKIQETNRTLSALATAQLDRTWLENNITLIKVVEMLTYANQHLIHSNFGLAENELLLAKEQLLSIRDSSPSSDHAYLQSIVDLIESGILNLPDDYSLAIEKIQLARQIAFQGLPDPMAGTSTPTPEQTPSATSTPDS